MLLLPFFLCADIDSNVLFHSPTSRPTRPISAPTVPYKQNDDVVHQEPVLRLKDGQPQDLVLDDRTYLDEDEKPAAAPSEQHAVCGILGCRETVNEYLLTRDLKHFDLFVYFVSVISLVGYYSTYCESVTRNQCFPRLVYFS